MSPVRIYGNDYATVAERVLTAHKEQERLSIATEMLSEVESPMILFRATVTTDKGVYTGYAQEIRGAEGIGGEAPIEVCETSAVGRALAFAGYIGDVNVKSIASADEMNSKAVKAPTPLASQAKVLPAKKLVSVDDVAKEFSGKEVEFCEGCAKIIEDSSGFTGKQIASFSKKKFGKTLCLSCQKQVSKK